MAEEAVAPEVAELTACGLAVVIPVAGSALPGGQRPLVGFFRTAQLPDSPDVMLVPLVCAEDADMVEVDEFVEASDEEEFCRWAVLRGPEANILVPSSLFMAARPFSSAAPHVVFGWNDKGGATAVIRGDRASFYCCRGACLAPAGLQPGLSKGAGLVYTVTPGKVGSDAVHATMAWVTYGCVRARCEMPSNGNGHGSRVVSADGPWGRLGDAAAEQCCGRLRGEGGRVRDGGEV